MSFCKQIPSFLCCFSTCYSVPTTPILTKHILYGKVLIFKRLCTLFKKSPVLVLMGIVRPRISTFFDLNGPTLKNLNSKYFLFCFVAEVTSQRCRRAPNKEARSIPRVSVSCVLMHNCYYEYRTSCCKHIILEGPIRRLTQINILNMQTQDEAMLPEAVSLYCRSVNATVP